MKRRNLRLTALLLACAVLLGSVAMAAPEDWEYEFPTNWSHDAMVFAVENGILRGDQNHNLNAEQPITRAELAAVLTRLLAATERADIAAYADVAETAWYHDELAAAVGAGLLNGISPTKMDPDAQITREQTVTVLCRAFGIVTEQANACDAFSDGASISNYARPYVSAMLENDLVHGYRDGSFCPQQSITRAEVAQLLYNYIDAIVDDPAQLPEQGNVVYRGTEALPSALTLDGSLVIGQAAPLETKPGDWRLTGNLTVCTGRGSAIDVRAVQAAHVTCAPFSGTVTADQPVWLGGGGAALSGATDTVTVLVGSHSASVALKSVTMLGGSLSVAGGVDQVRFDASAVMDITGNVRDAVLAVGGTITINGSVEKLLLGKNAKAVVNGEAVQVELDANASLEMNGYAKLIVLNGQYGKVVGSGYAEEIRILAGDTFVTLATSKLDNQWWTSCYENAPNVVQTQKAACVIDRDTKLYADRNMNKVVRELKQGEIVYNEYNNGGRLSVTLPDGTTGCIYRSTCTILDEPSTDGTVDYPTPTKEGFMDYLGYDSETDYLIWVSRYTQKVMVFQGSARNWTLIRTFPCGSGSNTTPTPPGAFRTEYRNTRWDYGGYYVGMPTIFNGGHAFHTVLLNYDGSYYNGTVGRPLSHGCVRMLPDDCRFIYELPLHTRVVVY